MKKLFSSIDKLITDIPDDKGAWEKAIEILDNDDLVESIMDKSPLENHRMGTPRIFGKTQGILNLPYM